MNWNDTRRQYPNRWLLIEATLAHSDENQRIVDDLSVVSEFDESQTALQRYLELHKKNPQREFYVVHTSREKLDIEERRWAGVRLSA